MTPMTRLRRSSSARTAWARRTRIFAIESSGAFSGSTGAAGFATREPGDPHRLGPVEVGGVAAVEATHVQVVDDVGQQLADVLDERGVGLDVPGDAEAAEHLLTEPVRRGDRGGVEARERAPQAPVALLDLVPRSGREHPDHRVALGGARPGEGSGEPPLGRHEALADAFAELARRHAGEGDEQDAVERRALGDVACRERRDRVRLAGPGARLEHGDARRQRPADVERPDVGRGAGHWSTTSSQASAPAHRRRASRPKRVVSVSSQPSPRSSGRGPSSSRSREREYPAEHELVLELGVLAREVPARLPRLRRRGDRVLARRSPRGRTPPTPRTRSAAAPASRGPEVDERPEVRERLVAVDRRDPRDRRARRVRTRPTVPARP